MNTTSDLSAALHQAFEKPTHGVVGLVGDLLSICPDNGLQLDWHADSCRIRYLGNGAEEILITTIQKSVFRALLARVAALCNERKPNSVSQYRGEGELPRSNDPEATIKITFVNTANEQKLGMIPVVP